MTTHRGSTATIIRIPYLSQLMDTKDFLFATVDVAIWSTVEPGIGITCAALACCRPLVRNFLSRSRLWGSSTGHIRGTSRPNNPSFNGYLRSGKHVVAIGYRGDAESQNQIIPDRSPKSWTGGRDRSSRGIEIDEELGQDTSHGGVELGAISQVYGRGSSKCLKNGIRWTMNSSKLADDSSEESRPVPPPKGETKATYNDNNQEAT
jgi:hypothetical protein